ncbi:serine/threonine-protein kinase [Klenkia brasiliensis]|uniref:serine/threonine-protein kinase n=1 Tax=Klenkia brasiliensis TaxID=333142 RepID=UPI0013F5B232|nr:serine/threonine-protein kinase [Klenkia brasiliensis]
MGRSLGRGGYGAVFLAVSEDGTEAAAKVIPKNPGASRELLFADLTGPDGQVRNVAPVIDSGETETSYWIVMPLAVSSLRDRMQSDGPALSLRDVLHVLTDIAAALADLDGRVVHRDIKPENVLSIAGHWNLADFGISRYVEAATATQTHKWSGTPQYLAPERWRMESATAAVDVYALGVIAYELLAGRLPFEGPDFRDQHLHQDPPALPDVAPRLASLIEECLFKSPQARPAPANLLVRLQRVVDAKSTPGAAMLAGAYQQITEQRRSEEIAASRARSEKERRELLAADASRSLNRISETLLDTVIDLAPTTAVARRPDGWIGELGNVQIGFSGARSYEQSDWRDRKPAIDVISYAIITIRIPGSSRSYEGRSHSLFFCDAVDEGRYAWYETAFMDTPLMRMRMEGGQDPYSLPPNEISGAALSRGMADAQVAWPFTELLPGDLDEFVDRWVGWFGAGVQGRLSRPASMPEGQPQGTWRQ